MHTPKLLAHLTLARTVACALALATGVALADSPSMALDGAFHRKHLAEGMSCMACHQMHGFPADFLFVRKYQTPPGAPGPVNRSVCLGCHQRGGKGPQWYGRHD